MVRIRIIFLIIKLVSTSIPINFNLIINNKIGWLIYKIILN